MKKFLLAAACGLVLVLGACSGGGQPRGLFVGYVTDKTEEEVVAKVGKPDAVEASNADTQRWIYKKKTFDAENRNRVDNETILIFRKDAGGKFKVTEVTFG